MNTYKPRVVFFGSSDFSTPTLVELSKFCDVLCVITNPPKQAGRGKKETKNIVHQTAESLGLGIIVTNSLLKGSNVRTQIDDILKTADISVVVSYGMIIPSGMLRLPKHGFINLHPSSLPKFRGAAPIERTIEFGESDIDICVINMTPELDAGDVFLRKTFKIKQSDTANSLRIETSKIGAEMIVETILSILNGTAIAKPQVGEPSYAHKISKNELLIENISKKPTKDVLNKIRALDSYGHCYLLFREKRLKIVTAIISDVQISKIDIQCSDGYVSPQLVIPEGKAIMKSEDFLRGVIVA